MEEITKKQSSKMSKKTEHIPGSGLYMIQSFEVNNIVLPFGLVGSNLLDIMKKKLVDIYEGKCDTIGFIKNNSIRILTYSAGAMVSGNCLYSAVVEALVCNPVEGMIFKVVVKNITKAGILAQTIKQSPVNVFIIRDQMHNKKTFNNVKVKDEITIKVIGTSFGLNDEKINVIASIVNKKKK